MCPSLVELFTDMKRGEKERKKSTPDILPLLMCTKKKRKKRTDAQMLLLLVSGPFHQTRWNTATRVVSDDCKGGWMDRVDDGSVNKCWSRKGL